MAGRTQSRSLLKGWLLAALTLEVSAGDAIPGTGLVQSMIGGLTPEDFGHKSFHVGGLTIPAVNAGEQGINLTNLNLKDGFVENGTLQGTHLDQTSLTGVRIHNLALENSAVHDLQMQDVGVRNLALDGSANLKSIQVREMDVNGSASLNTFNMEKMRLGHVQLGSLDLETELDDVLLLVKLVLLCGVLILLLLSARLCFGLGLDVCGCCRRELANSRKKDRRRDVEEDVEADKEVP